MVKIVLATKKTNVLACPDQVDEMTDFLAYEDTAYGVFGDGIFYLGNKKERAITHDWQGDVLAAAYAGNVYLLLKETGVIWRYQGGDQGFGAKQNWLAGGTKPDFGEAKQISIDGAVWVLTGPTTILKFSLGCPQNFIPKDVFPEIKSVAVVYSDEESRFFYVLEPTQKRLVVLEKNGQYKAQYLADEIGQATSLAVSEKEKKAVYLAGDKLYSFEIKHL